ncbi:hypothetical protein U91I_00368 [alpha proteobacterium U9-1i]|nr:hypothetical protein U91I_00368 [alpha proteobacterium U9-1i]
MAAHPEIRKPALFTFVTLASAIAAIGACFCLAGLAVAPQPQMAAAEGAGGGKAPKLATSIR